MVAPLLGIPIYYWGAGLIAGTAGGVILGGKEVGENVGEGLADAVKIFAVLAGSMLVYKALNK